MDLSRPLVGSEGNLDPFDGLVTCRLLRDPAGEGHAAVLATAVCGRGCWRPCRGPRGPAGPGPAAGGADQPPPPLPCSAAGGDPSVLAAETADFEAMVENKCRR